MAAVESRLHMNSVHYWIVERGLYKVMEEQILDEYAEICATQPKTGPPRKCRKLEHQSEPESPTPTKKPRRPLPDLQKLVLLQGRRYCRRRRRREGR
jgi:hypothetical protein